MFGFSSIRCCDCAWLDERDRNKYGEYYCNEKREYVSGDDYTCRYFKPNFYVMTAYCNINKLPYDCDMMKSLISFRDNYMMYDETGKSFLEEYESIGPILAVRLQADIYRTDIVKEMEEDYIRPALSMINMQDFDGAQDSYIKMIEMLKIRYGYAPKNDKKKVKK